MDSSPTLCTRRAFVAATSGLVISVALPLRSGKLGASGEDPDGTGGTRLSPNVFVRVGPDSTVTVLIKHLESGQGPWTGLATLVADEMDADWSQMRTEHAPADAMLYGNPEYGDYQVTGGSTSIKVSFELMRRAGAGARAMLVAAAADSWGVSAEEITVSRGLIRHPGSGREALFGEFAEAAARRAPPTAPMLKTPAQFIYIGKHVPRLDTAAKAKGSAIYTLDVYPDNALVAVVRHPEHFGAKVASVDEAAALAVKGCRGVKKINAGVAVYADNTHAALKARDALVVEWDLSNAEIRSSEEMAEECGRAVQRTGAPAHRSGEPEASFATAAEIIEAEYIFPFLAHAPMETLDAVLARAPDRTIDAWMGSQNQTLDKRAIAEACGVGIDSVRLHTMLAGGSFGRRAQQQAEFAREAAEVFMVAGGETPVKLMWTREDDIRGGFYRPIVAHKLRAALDASGAIVGWEHVIAGRSFLKKSPWEDWIQGGVDPILVEGAVPPPYHLPNAQVSCHVMEDSPVPVLWLRANAYMHSGYAIETFIDELLEKAGRDAVDGRLELMTHNPRLAVVLRRTAELAGWGRVAAEGRALGVAAVQSYETAVAQIVEVSLENDVPKVHKVWCAIDCGLVVNPEIVRAQVEGGVGFGLNAALFNELVLERGGRVRQSNFHDYRSLRIDEMPDVEVDVLPSDAEPTGVGEVAVPPIGPAVANAVRRLTGKPIRRLPMVNTIDGQST
jgi:isoquinoline 1-oxidoreductase beta subunit